MRAYILRRLLVAVPTFFGITFVVFAAVRFLPGDVITQMQGMNASLSPQARKQLETQYSLDQGIVQQYGSWLGKVLQGNLGKSLLSGRPVADDLKQRIPVTLELTLIAFAVALLVSVPVGVLSGARPNTVVDHVGRALAIGALAMPSFLLALLVIVYGYDWFGWIPPIRYHTPWEQLGANLNIMWVPGAILGFGLAGSLMRLTRSMMLEAMSQDYIRTARAKGLPAMSVVMRHALRNALIPVITVLGLQIAALIGGAVILEQIFAIPGMGQLMLVSLSNRDYPVVQAIILLTGSAILLTNFVVDISYRVLDPRITM